MARYSLFLFSSTGVVHNTKIAFLFNGNCSTLLKIHIYVRKSGNLAQYYEKIKKDALRGFKGENLLFMSVVADKKLSYGFYLAGKTEHGYHVSGKYFGAAVRYENSSVTQD